MPGSLRYLRSFPLTIGLICVTGLSAAIAVCLFFAYPAHPDISEQAYKQVMQGMTLRDIEILVGSPPGRYGSFPVFDPHWASEKWNGEEVLTEVWQTDGGVLIIGFTADGRASEKFFLFGRSYPSERNCFDRVRIYLFRRLHDG